MTLLLQRRLANEIGGHAAACDIKMLPPLCPLAVSPVDFTHGAELISRSRATSSAWIRGGGIDLPAPERFLSPHHHSPESRADRHTGFGDRDGRGAATA
jgi:NTE family protein